MIFIADTESRKELIGIAEYILNAPNEATEELYRDKWKAKRLVRCKDCKHKPEVKEIEIYGRIEKYPLFPDDSTCPVCNTSDSYYSWIPDDNWFCANGEQKDGANE